MTYGFARLFGLLLTAMCLACGLGMLAVGDWPSSLLFVATAVVIDVGLREFAEWAEREAPPPAAPASRVVIEFRRRAAIDLTPRQARDQEAS